MSFSTRSPLRVGGANFNSGAPSTGEVNVTRGGQFTAVIWSGALNPSLVGCQTGAIASGNNVQLVSGMGRLNTIMPHSFLTSGQPVYFYDAAAITVSGVSVSGQRIIGIIPNTMRAPLVALSGNPVTTIAWEDRMIVDIPFSSGLCVSAASGAPGFTCSYTVETGTAGVP